MKKTLLTTITVLGIACLSMNSHAQTGWLLQGNSNATTNDFIGTINNIPLKFKTKNATRMVITGTGKVGIANAAPVSRLDILGLTSATEPVVNVTGKYVGSADVIAIKGTSTPSDTSGIGVQGVGNLAGVEGISNLFGDVDPYLELEQKLIQKEEYLCHYDINKGEYVVFCLSVSDLYEKDYEYFIDGKYSKIRREIKDYKTPCTPAYNLINTRWKDQGVTGVNIKCIMDKSSLLKKQFETLKGIEIPEGAEIFTSYQDKHFKEKEHFDESKLTLKTFLR